MLEIAFQSVLAIGATVVAYLGACRLCRRIAFDWLNPVIVAILLLVAGLWLVDVSQATYFAAAYPLHWLLVPAFATLALPLKQQLRIIVGNMPALCILTLCGSIIAIFSAVFLPVVFGAQENLVATLAAKSLTTSIAVELSSMAGGYAGLTAVVAICTGLLGMCFGPPIFRALGIVDEGAQGLALGIASHALGTVRAFQISRTAGTYATIGMILNALVTAVIFSVAVASAP